MRIWFQRHPITGTEKFELEKSRARALLFWYNVSMNSCGSENKNKVIVGSIYTHEEGLRYRVESIDTFETIQSNKGDSDAVLNATGYEKNHEVSWVKLIPSDVVDATTFVRYEQLDGASYPKGTYWVRELSDFISYFTFYK